MANWYCICGNFVKDKRFCPRCKLVRFRLNSSPILDYWGLNLGELSNGLSFNFPVQYLENHVLITGQTGTGKTRFAMKLAVEAENYESPQRMKLLVVDVEGEWKGIISKLKGKTEYYDVGANLKINPFDLDDPALIRELLRETVFKGIEKEYIDLSAQMNFVLQETISESKNIGELIANIRQYDRQKLTAIDKTKTALLVRLDPFMRSPLKEIFYCKKSNPDLTKLDEHNLVIDLHALDARVAYGNELRLIYNTLSSYFLRKMLARDPTNKVSNLFIADEAQLLVPKILQKIVVTESWPATEFVTRLRKRGCGLVLITQSPSNIEKDIFKNTATKIVFRSQSNEDIKLLADSAGFSDIIEYEYLSENLVRLGRKAAVVCTQGYDPFLIKAADFEPAKYDMSAPAVAEEFHSTECGVNQLVIKDDDENVFLQSITDEPFLSVTERRPSLGWNDKKYSAVVDNLLKRGIIERIRVKLGRGSPMILYQRRGKTPSVKHEFYVWWITRKLAEKRFVTKRNKVGPDIEVPEVDAVIEVELGKSNVHGNIRNDLKKFNFVVVCSDEKSVLECLSGREKPQNVFFSLVQNAPSLIEKMRPYAARLDC